jgi:hypothetical protein
VQKYNIGEWSLSFTFAGTANGKAEFSWHNFRSISACHIIFLSCDTGLVKHSSYIKQQAHLLFVIL